MLGPVSEQARIHICDIVPKNVYCVCGECSELTSCLPAAAVRANHMQGLTLIRCGRALAQPMTCEHQRAPASGDDVLSPIPLHRASFGRRSAAPLSKVVSISFRLERARLHQHIVVASKPSPVQCSSASPADPALSPAAATGRRPLLRRADCDTDISNMSDN